MDDAYVTGRPTPLLRPFIERYVGYRLTGGDPGRHLGLPSKFATFVISIGEPVEVVRQTNEAQSPNSYRVVLSGLQDSTAVIEHGGSQEGVAIELKPTGLRALFGMPACELWDTTVEITDVQKSGVELWEQLQETPDWAGRFGACDRFLTGVMREDRARTEVAAAWELISRAEGRMSVDEVAQKVALSRHHLGREFKGEFGLGPKLASRLVRFESAFTKIKSGLDLVSVAADSGYSDQAHMNRDFVSFSGVTPARLVAEQDVTFVQDIAA